MTPNGYVQILLYIVVLIALAKPLGSFMTRVYEGKPTFPDRVLGPIERLSYRLCGTRPEEEMNWKTYCIGVLLFNLAGIIVVYVLQRAQQWLPLNPHQLTNVAPDLAFNTATSFGTNTNWQAYGGESTLSYLTQMAALTVQNFVSAATGMAVLVALIRGFTRHTSATIGNFWVDLVRSTLYILLPLSILLAGILISQGVVQTFADYPTATMIQGTTDADGKPVTEQTIAVGPAASQIAIKQLGTNGGGFFSVNSAHPFENPTPVSNFFQMLSILLIGAALCYTFGQMVKDTRQGWAILAAMSIIFVGCLAVCVWQEQKGNPSWSNLGLDMKTSILSPGGNMEGKEARFGVVNSAIWATATTAASNGSVNSMHDSFTPLGGLIPLWMIQLGEVIYGGVGSGLYGMLMFVIVAVFVAGLMVGRTPEYLGKKIEPFEMKMASLVILIPPLVVLVGTAIAIVYEPAKKSILNPGPHGFSEVLYAFSSAGNNNGSAFGGLTVNTPFYNTALGIAMLFARYWLMIPVLAIAGSLAAKKSVPATSGTLPTHTPLFVVLLIGTVLIVGALTFIPALALGPIVEHLQMMGH